MPAPDSSKIPFTHPVCEGMPGHLDVAEEERQHAADANKNGNGVESKPDLSDNDFASAAADAAAAPAFTGFDGRGNLTAVLTGFKTFKLEDRPVATLKGDQILVRVMATGICGTDLSFYLARGMRPLSKPHVLGHESCGVVLAVGPETRNIKVGERVAIEPALPCRVCRYCKKGQWNYCVHDGYMATPPTDGTMTRLFVCSEHNAVPLPDKITWQESGCIQPLAVAVQIARRAGVLAHQSVAVVGCGPLGLLTLAVARAHGARALVAIDVNPARVEFAQRYIPQAKCYAMPQFAPTPSPTQASAEQLQAHCIDFANKVIKDVGAAHAHGLDVVVEASGAESAILTGMHLLRHGGTYVQAGLGRPFTMFPTFALADKELTIRGSLRYTAGCFEDAIHLIEVGAVDVKSLITRTVPLSHVEQAFEAFARGDEIKVVIMNQE